MMIRSYYVAYTHPGLGSRASSRWGLRTDAKHYAQGLPASYTNIDIIASTQWPEIFPHCPGSISQAIGGKCFTCGTVLTVAHAKAFQSPDTDTDTE